MIKVSPFSFSNYIRPVKSTPKYIPDNPLSPYVSLGMDSKGINVISKFFDFIGKCLEKFRK